MDSEQYRLSKNLIYLRQAGSECSVNIYLNNTRRGLTQARNTFGNMKQAPYNKESSKKPNVQTKYSTGSFSSRSAHYYGIDNFLSASGIVTRQSSATSPIYCNLLNLWLFHRKERFSNLFSSQRYLPKTCNY